MPKQPSFDSAAFLTEHCREILKFYQPNAFDPEGGFFQNFDDDGRVFDAQSRHLVSSTRFVFNFAEAYRRGFGEHYLDWARHAFKYLQTHHLNPETGAYQWQLGPEADRRVMAYGQAFVILASAAAWRVGIPEAEPVLYRCFDLLEKTFFEPAYFAYADECSEDLSRLDAYRGQNANMHLCEAFILAYEVSDDAQFLEKAIMLARRFAGDQAAKGDGLIWEHYKTDWTPDWEYNRDKPNDLFKPWGFQPGHQVEWAKLLLQLNRISPNRWYVERAAELFNRAMDIGWDEEFGGLVYGVSPEGGFSDAGKYFWVHAEAFAAAYRLYRVTGDPLYLDWYNRIWVWSDRYLVDHERGAWYRVRHQDGSAVDHLKSPMGKVDYHTLGACWDVLDQLTD